ncbi:MAG TPA: class I SAM-dependent methyltransferase [Thermoplasmata archaeon]|nr:class I SAM-dependent methyltransferase [Thermoplasmata archaeon]
MGEHYSSARPTSRRRPAEVSVVVHGLPLTLQTDAGVFSRGSLDRGTELLIEALDLGPCELILDLGCGYGAIGIAASRLSDGGHVVLTDVNERAVRLARENLRANRVTNAEVRAGDLYEPVAGMAFDHIVCNPPIRAGRAVVDRIVSEAPAHLLDGGRLWLVARTRQGADAIRTRMANAFGHAEIVRRGSGYKVLCSAKEARSP